MVSRGPAVGVAGLVHVSARGTAILQFTTSLCQPRRDNVELFRGYLCSTCDCVILDVCTRTHTHRDMSTHTHTNTNVHRQPQPHMTTNLYAHTCTRTRICGYERGRERESDSDILNGHTHTYTATHVTKTQRYIITVNLPNDINHHHPKQNGHTPRCRCTPPPHWFRSPLVVCEAIRGPNDPMHILTASQIKTARSTNTIV